MIKFARFKENFFHKEREEEWEKVQAKKIILDDYPDIFKLKGKIVIFITPADAKRLDIPLTLLKDYKHSKTATYVFGRHAPLTRAEWMGFSDWVKKNEGKLKADYVGLGGKNLTSANTAMIVLKDIESKK